MGARGGFFGRIGDLIGRSRAALFDNFNLRAFTGLSAFAHEWWHLLIFRFLSALGIGGEWAVGACLLSETCPAAGGLGLPRLCNPPSTLASCSRASPVTCLRNNRRATSFWWELSRRCSCSGFGGQSLSPRSGTARAAKPPPKRRASSICFGARGPLDVDCLGGLRCFLKAHWTFMYWHTAHLRNLPEVLAMSPEDRNHQSGCSFIPGHDWLDCREFFLAGTIAWFHGYRKR